MKATLELKMIFTEISVLLRLKRKTGSAEGEIMVKNIPIFSRIMTTISRDLTL